MDINWFHGLVVMTPDFDACQFSGNSGSIPDGTFFFFSSSILATFDLDEFRSFFPLSPIRLHYDANSTKEHPCGEESAEQLQEILKSSCPN